MPKLTLGFYNIKGNKMDNLSDDESKIELEAENPLYMFIEMLTANEEQDILCVTSSELHRRYLEWLETYSNNYDSVTLQSFGVRLTNLRIPGISIKLTKKCTKRILDMRILRKHFHLLSNGNRDS